MPEVTPRERKIKLGVVAQLIEILQSDRVRSNPEEAIKEIIAIPALAIVDRDVEYPQYNRLKHRSLNYEKGHRAGYYRCQEDMVGYVKEVLQ